MTFSKSDSDSTRLTSDQEIEATQPSSPNTDTGLGQTTQSGADSQASNSEAVGPELAPVTQGNQEKTSRTNTASEDTIAAKSPETSGLASGSGSPVMPRRPVETATSGRTLPPRKRGTPSSTEDLDLPLKLLTKHLLTGMGYYSDVAVGIYTYSYTPGFKRENLSDIDVFGVQFDPDLSPREVVVECKSTDENALEEVFKLKGVMEWKQAARAMLVKQRIASNAREVGHKLGVRTLDASELSTLLDNLGLMKPNLLATLLSNHRRRQATLLVAKQQYSKAVTYLTAEYWNVSHNRNIQSIMTMLDQVGPKLDLAEESHLFLFLEAVKLLSISILHMGGEIIGTGLSNPGNRVRDYLFGGARERREREILFDRINQQLGVDTKFYPHYMADLEELTMWILRSPAEARQIPLCLDYIANSVALNLASFPLSSIETGYGRVTLKLSKDVLALAVKISGVTSQPVRRIMQL